MSAVCVRKNIHIGKSTFAKLQNIPHARNKASQAFNTFKGFGSSTNNHIITHFEMNYFNHQTRLPYLTLNQSSVWTFIISIIVFPKPSHRIRQST
jgi:hypothetical protein